MARGRHNVNAARRLAIARGRRGARGLGKAAPMPWDSTAERESAELGGEAADTRASLAARYAAAQSGLGFGVGADNPYSKSARNLRSLESTRRGTLNTAGNQLYSGSTANRLREADRSYDEGQKALAAEESEARGAFTSGMATTARESALGKAAIQEGAIARVAKAEPAKLAVGRGRGTPRRAVVGRGRARTQGVAIDATARGRGGR